LAPERAGTIVRAVRDAVVADEGEGLKSQIDAAHAIGSLLPSKA
jgi:hypothetical protein